MKTGELLDHLAAHVLDDRAEMLNGSPDELWSDEVLIRWLNEGARELCRKAWVLEDVAHPTAGTIALVAGTKEYALHASVVRVLSARLSDTDVDLLPVAYDRIRPQMDALTPLDDFLYPTYPYVEPSNRPQVYATQVATRRIRVRPAPDATTVAAAPSLLMRVSRMPIVELAASEPNREPEIPAEFHLSLTDYAAWRALTIPAADAALRSLGAGEYKPKWLTTVNEARRERERAEMAHPTWRFGGWANGR